MAPDSKFWSVLGWLGIATLFGATAWLLFHAQWTGTAIMAGFALASVVLVSIRRQLPALFSFLFVAASLSNAAGYVWDLFHNKGTYVWYDEVVHGFTMATIGLALAFWIHHARADDPSRWAVWFVALVAGAALVLGVAWEIFEWAVGIIGSPWDTFMDLVMDVLGGVVAGVFAVWMIRTHPPEELRADETDDISQAAADA